MKPRLLAWTAGQVIISLTVVATQEMACIWEEDEVLCLGLVEFEVSVGQENGGIQLVVRRDLGWKWRFGRH